MSRTHVTDVRLRSINVTWRTTWEFVVVETSDGHLGIGEWSDAASRQLSYQAAQEQAKALIGQPLDQALETVHSQVQALEPKPSSDRRRRATILGGFDAALCDAAARRAGISLPAWLGSAGPCGPVGLYANINRAIGPRTAEEFAKQARAAVAAGFTTIKCAPFDFLVGSRRISQGLSLAAAVREEVGDDVELLLDLHGLLEVREVIAVADELLQLRPGWLEDAAEVADVDGLRAVRERTGLPMAGGEFVAHPAELEPALQAGVLDVFMPDVKHAGGPRQAANLGRLAASAGAQVSLHNPCGPVATAHSAAVTALLSAGSLEYAFGESPERPLLISPDEPVQDGRFILSASPGLGHRLASTTSLGGGWSSI